MIPSPSLLFAGATLIACSLDTTGIEAPGVGAGPSVGGCYWPEILTPDADCTEIPADGLFRFFSSTIHLSARWDGTWAWIVDFSTGSVTRMAIEVIDGDAYLANVRCVRPME